MKKLILPVSFFFIASIGMAQEPVYKALTNTGQLEKRLTASSLKTTTIQADFIQKKHLEYLDAVIESEGKFRFKKKASLRWEYTKPFQYTIVLNNDKFTIKDANKKSEFDLKSNPAFQEVIGLISGSVQGTLVSGNKFHVKAFESKTQYQVKLEPKSRKMKEILKIIIMFFNKSDLSVSRVKMVENEEDYTDITFKNKVINEAIPESVFIVQ